MPDTIAIVGGGFCGTLTAVHLLRSPAARGRHIILIHRETAPARGLAYGTRVDSHVLNVPAARMGACPDDEAEFLRFAQRRDAASAGGEFLPRRLYGDYLQWLLEDALARRAPGVRFSHRLGHVVDLEVASAGGVHLLFEDGALLRADRAVLALGNSAPGDPAPDASVFCRPDNPRYVGDPWAPAALQRVDLDKPVLLIGSGLTTVDIAIELVARGLRQPLWVVSRRGLTPLAHRGLADVGRRVELPAALSAGPATARHYLHALRTHLRAAPDTDWREIVAALRPLTPLLWERLDARERARFLRHLQPYWEIHRHRLAPAPAQRFAELIDSGQLRLRAGRIRTLHCSDDGLAQVTFRPRGSRDTETLTVGSVINCTGPASNPAQWREPLLAALLRRGLVRADPLRLGLAVADNYALVGADGVPSAALYYVGPLLKAQFWEATAVPELRVHVQRLARQLAAAAAG